MDKKTKQYFIYMLFAVVAIIVNIGFQIIAREVIILIFSEFAFNFIALNSIKFEYWFLGALAFGTLIGFIFKFIVDKFIVFEEKRPIDDSIEKTGKQLFLYLGFAVFTTIIFWGLEILFKVLLPGDWYLVGGIIGLAIGYTVKFLLDRKYVFV